MPHCILEYSDNILEQIESTDILRRLNFFISEKFPVNITKIKSRLAPREYYLVSNGEVNQSFIHLEVLVLEGRDKQSHINLSENLQLFLKEEFKRTIENCPCSLTVEVRAMDKDIYMKDSFGNL